MVWKTKGTLTYRKEDEYPHIISQKSLVQNKRRGIIFRKAKTYVKIFRITRKFINRLECFQNIITKQQKAKDQGLLCYQRPQFLVYDNNNRMLYLISVHLYDHGPFTSPTVSKISHVTVHLSLLAFNFQFVSFVSIGPGLFYNNENTYSNNYALDCGKKKDVQNNL